MKRFILSAFSVVLAAGAVAPTAQALPKVDPAFNLQTLRLSELDTRNKSEDDQQPYDTTYDTYEQQTLGQPTVQNAPGWQEQPASAESTVWENAEAQSEANDQSPSLTARRQASLDRS